MPGSQTPGNPERQNQSNLKSKNLPSPNGALARMSRRGRAKALRLARDLAKGSRSEVPIVELTKEIVTVCESYRTGRRPAEPSVRSLGYLDSEAGFNRRRRRKDILKEGPPPDCKLGLESRTELSSFLLVADMCGLKSTKGHRYGGYFSFIPKRKLPNYIRANMFKIIVFLALFALAAAFAPASRVASRMVRSAPLKMSPTDVAVEATNALSSFSNIIASESDFGGYAGPAGSLILIGLLIVALAPPLAPKRIKWMPGCSTR